MNKIVGALAPMALTFLVGCSGMSGTSSLTMMSDQNEKMNQYYTPIGGEISQKECLTRIFFLGWFGTQPVHESLLAKMLDENKADALLNAEFSNTMVDFYLFANQCAKITGTPAKLKGAQ